MKTLTQSLVRDALFAIGYIAVFYALFQTAHLFWYLPAGWRFAALLLSPYRRWPWLFVAEALLFTWIQYDPFLANHGLYGFAALVSNPLLAAAGPYLLRQTDWTVRPASLATMAWLLATMVIAALGAMLGNLFYPFSESDWLSPIRMLLQITLGDYVGMLVLVPLALMALKDRPDEATLRCWRVDMPFVLLPVLLLYVGLIVHSGESQVYFLSALLCFVPSIHFAVRSGWRGATLALSTTSVAIIYAGMLSGNPELVVEAQGLLAIAGSTALLLGAMQDALRDKRLALEASNRNLIAANSQQSRLADELRDAARRNLDLSERTRRWITSELHDEIGQNLAALQAHVRLLERKAGAEGGTISKEIAQSLQRMRRAISGLMASLRPAGLDDFGLVHTLHEGAIRSLLDTSNIAFDVQIEDLADCIGRLDDTAQTALYRIAQEAATNTARHSGANCFHLRLRAREFKNGCRVVLAIDDDGHGFDLRDQSAGIGLQGIRDRVLSLGGRFRERSDANGTRLHVRLHFPLAG